MNFVTGGTGLVGAHLLFDLINAGQKVRALHRSKSNLEIVRKVFNFYSDSGDELYSKIDWVEGDILDIHALLDVMRGCKHVFHSAAMVSYQSKDAERIYQVNVEGTANMVNAALELGVDKFCHVSSTAAVGKELNFDGEVEETSLWQKTPGVANYTISKYSAEQEVWRAAEEGLEMVIVNPSVIIGPGDWNQSSGTIFKSIWNGLSFYTEGINGFVDARDVSRAALLLSESKVTKERFLLVSENLPFQELFSQIARRLGRPEAKVKAKRWMTEVAWRWEAFVAFFTGRTPVITKETSKSVHNRYRYSNKKIKEAFNFQFTPVDQAIDNASRFYLQHFHSN